MLIDTTPFAGKLPHYVAVCITKFDDNRVSQAAKDIGVRFSTKDSGDQTGALDADSDAALSFLWNLNGKSGGGEQVIRVLEQNFYPERIRYFVTSAVGFQGSPTRQASGPEDFRDAPQDKESHYVRAGRPVRPINVAEPLLWLSQQLTRISS
jgi:hypothetical protein